MEQQRNVFSIKIDAGKTEETIAKLTADLRAAKDANDALEKSYKAGKVSLEEYGKQSAASKRTLNDLGSELRGHTILLAHHTKQTKEELGSNNQMRAQLSGLTQQYNALSKAERENADVGGVLKKQIRELSDTLKENESAVGDNRRNVGNYTGGILQAVDGTGLLATITNTATKAQEGYNILLNATRASMVGNITGMKALNLVMKANVIGIVITALAGLVAFLTRTQEGIDWVSVKTKGLTTVFGFLTDKLSGVGELLFNAFSSPKQALTSLMDFLQGQVVNRVKAFGVIFQGIANRDLKMINNGLFQLSLGVENTVEKVAALATEMGKVARGGEAIEKENIRIRDAERALNVERANSRKAIKELNLIAEDTRNSTQKRLKAVRDALAIEEGLNKKQLALQKAVIANIENEQRGRKLLTADHERMAEASKKLSETEAESLELRTELTNKMNTIRNEGIALQQKASLQELENRKAQIEAEMLAAKEGTRERLDLQEELIRQELAIQNRGADLSLQQRKVNELKANAEILALRASFYEASTTEELRHRGGLAEEVKQAEDVHSEDRFQAMEKRRQQQVASEEEVAQAKIAAAEIAAAAAHEIEMERLDTAIMVTDTLSTLVEVAAGQSEEAANFQKALAIFQIGIKAAQAVMSGIEKAADAGPFPLNLVAIVGTVTTVLGHIAQAKALLSEGSAPKAPKFDAGGFTGSGFGSPDESGFRVAGVVHQDEYVVPKKVLFDPSGWEYVKILEGMRLGKGFNNGGFTSGVGGLNIAPSTRQLSFEQKMQPARYTPAIPLSIDYNKLAAAMAQVHISASIREINAKAEEVKYTTNRASIRG